MNYEKAAAAFIDAHREEMVQTLAEFVRIPSVRSAAKENMPYGEGVERALAFIGNAAKGMGFTVDNFENKIVYADAGGEPPLLGILCHADVVEAETQNWSAPPFSPVIRNEKIYGRGTHDNKGPAVAALYAAYAIKEVHAPLRGGVRVYFGGNEESGLGDFGDYIKANKLPKYCFVPDSCFPVGVSEKGRIILYGNVNVATKRIVLIECGTAQNIIPERAEIIVQNCTERQLADSIGQYEGIRCETLRQGDFFKIVIRGKSAHSASLEKGANAATAALDICKKLEPDCPVFASLVSRFPHGAHYGEGFGTAAGQTTLGVVFLRYDGKNLAIGSDSRVSVGANAAELGETFRRGLPFKVEIKTIEPYAVPREAPIVKRLQDIYKKYTGRTDPPYDMNAMTYMHMTQGGVIFGGVLYGDGSRNAHAADECYNLDTFVLAAKMFAAAILEVCGKEANDL